MVDRLWGGTLAITEQLPSSRYAIKDIKCNVHTGHIVTLKTDWGNMSWFLSRYLCFARRLALDFTFLSIPSLDCFLNSLLPWDVGGSGHVWDCLKTLILFLLGIGCWLLFQRLWIWLWVAKHGVNARRVARRASPLLCLVCALGTCGGGLQKNSILSEGRGFYFNCVFGFLNVFRWWGRLLVWINASVWCARRMEGP